MDLSTIFWLAVLVVVVLVPVLAMGPWAWRIWRHNEEMVPGGSLGRQYLGRSEDRKPKHRSNDDRRPRAG
jgi:hypothetical protein